MNNNQPIREVSKELGIVISGTDETLIRQVLANKINDLLNTDFQRLISILYRVDVSETKLKSLLKDNPGSDAGLIIADLMIERQAQKIRSRQEHRRDPNISDEEGW
jgi:hypothetical protein